MIAMILSPMIGLIAGQGDALSFGLNLIGALRSLFFLCVWVGGIVGPVILIHFLFSLPMRRAERARLFLDLIEDALKRGQSAEVEAGVLRHVNQRAGLPLKKVFRDRVGRVAGMVGQGVHE